MLMRMKPWRKKISGTSSLQNKFLECKLQGMKTVIVDEDIFMSICVVRMVYNIKTNKMGVFWSQP